jgi:hypothetical protein
MYKFIISSVILKYNGEIRCEWTSVSFLFDMNEENTFVASLSFGVYQEYDKIYGVSGVGFPQSIIYVLLGHFSVAVESLECVTLTFKQKKVINVETHMCWNYENCENIGINMHSRVNY